MNREGYDSDGISEGGSDDAFGRERSEVGNPEAHLLFDCTQTPEASSEVKEKDRECELVSEPSDWTEGCLGLAAGLRDEANHEVSRLENKCLPR
jgi:hypothetical protein